MNLTIQEIWDNILSHLNGNWHLYAIGILLLIMILMFMKKIRRRIIKNRKRY